MMPSIASVAMNEFTRRRVTTTELKKPPAAPVAMHAITPRAIAAPEFVPAIATITLPPTTEERMMFAPKEMSSSPAPRRKATPTPKSAV